ncbi:MAG TPA: hypothetical protein VNU26_07895 [Mycobacteriales bacterium]|nr:hypothetical protein [Mycobacteriales bacterium]
MTANTLTHPHLRPGSVIRLGALLAVAALVAVVAVWLTSGTDTRPSQITPVVEVGGSSSTGVANSDRPGSPDSLDRRPVETRPDAYPQETGRRGSPDALDRRR